MYKRYYDGYSSDVISGNAVVMPNGDTPKHNSVHTSDAPQISKNDDNTPSIESDNEVSANSPVSDISLDGGVLSTLGLGNTKTDDLILIGVLIILLTENDNPDIPLLLIVAFIFLSGYIL